MSNLAYALRRVWHARGTFLLTSLLIGSALGSNAIVLGIIQAAFFRPLPVQQPSRLLQLYQLAPNLPPQPGFGLDTYEAVRQSAASLSDVFAQFETSEVANDGTYPTRVFALHVTTNYFSALGTSPYLGRTLVSGDRDVAVLSYDYWKRNYGRATGTIGRAIRLDDRWYRIVGVMPAGFFGIDVDHGPDITIPVDEKSAETIRAGQSQRIQVVARLRTGASLAEAQTAINRVRDQVVRASIAEVARAGATPAQLDAFTQSISGTPWRLDRIGNGVSWLRTHGGPLLWTLLGSTYVLLLIAGVTVGGIMLARVLAARKEMAVRLALGATKAHLLRRWEAETLASVLLSGLVAWVFVRVGTPIVQRLLPSIRSAAGALRPLQLDISPTPSVLMFEVGACAFVIATATLIPAVYLLRTSDSSWTHLRGGGAGDSRPLNVLRTVSVVQIALCSVLLVGAFLSARSLEHLRHVDPGFDQERVAAMSIQLSASSPAADRVALPDRLLQQVRLIPGVSHAALALRPLMQGVGGGTTVVTPGQRLSDTELMNTSVNGVGAGYFQTLGVPVIRGREFQQSDSTAVPGGLVPAIVNESFARHFFPGAEAIGAQFGTGRVFTRAAFIVVGVVADSKYRSIRENPTPVFYYPAFRNPTNVNTFTLYIRGRANSDAALLERVQELTRSSDPQVAVFNAQTLDAQVDDSLAPDRLLASVAVLFAVFAVCLAGAGFYAALAYFVALNVRPIGIRRALGAGPLDITLGLLNALRWTIFGGLGAGVAVAILAGPVLRKFLYGITPSDPVSVAGAVGVLVVSLIVASLIPIRRAMAIDPAAILRQE